MSINLVSLKCPDCGAQLNIEQGRKEAFCSYCGAKILVNNENEHVYRYIDEAALKRAETEHMVRMNEERRRALEDERKRAQEEDQRRVEQRVFAEQEEKRKKKRRIWLIAGGVVILLGFLSALQSPEMSMVYWMLGSLLMVWGFVSTKSPNYYSDRNEQTGVKKVKAPSSIAGYEKKSYTSIEAILKGAGFTNVQCVPLNDLKVGLLQKPGTVESITIGGHSVTSGGKKFPSDAAVVISYHNFADR